VTVAGAGPPADRIFTGFPKRERRPSFGSYVSRLAQRRDAALPKFVSLKGDDQEIAEAEAATLGRGAAPSIRAGTAGIKDTRTTRQVDLSRLKSRQELLAQLDTLRRDVDASGEMRAFDAFTGQAFDMLTSGKARRAFDLSDEKPETLDRYRAGGNKFMYSHSSSPVSWDWESFVRARRLVEAGVSFVSMQVGLWDHHCAEGLPTIFESYRSLLPLYDACLSALITDLHERGLPPGRVRGGVGRVRAHAADQQIRRPRPLAGGRQRALLRWRAEDGTIRRTTSSGGEYRSPAPTPRRTFWRRSTTYSGSIPRRPFPTTAARPQYLLDDRDPVKELI